MDFQDESTTLGSLRKRFYDRRRESELLDDCISEALTTKAVPITILLSAHTYTAIRDGALKNNGMFGIMRKNLLCMFIGIGISLIGIKGNYYEKVAMFYSSHRYQELRNLIAADLRKSKEEEDQKRFVQPNHLNLDLERPHLKGIDVHRGVDTNQVKELPQYIENITYEELQRKNREKYAIKHSHYY